MAKVGLFGVCNMLRKNTLHDIFIGIYKLQYVKHVTYLGWTASSILNHMLLNP